MHTEFIPKLLILIVYELFTCEEHEFHVIANYWYIYEFIENSVKIEMETEFMGVLQIDL